eukprot:261379_1
MASQHNLAILKQEFDKYIENELIVPEKESDAKPHMRKIRTVSRSHELNEFDHQLDSNENRLKQWNGEVQELVNTFASYTDLSSNENKIETPELDINTILKQYTECSNLLTPVQSKVQFLAEYTKPLNVTTNGIGYKIKQFDADMNSLQHKHTKNEIEYKKSKKKRINLQENIKKLMDELNRSIDIENEMYQQKEETQSRLNTLTLEKQQYQISLQNFRILKTNYQKYMEDIKAVTETFNAHFTKKMDFHEKNWAQWSCDDVSNWIKYLNQIECINGIKLSNNVDLDVVAENMKNHGTCGTVLDELERKDWKHLGVKMLNDRKQIHDKIQKLLTKYPRLYE